MNRFTKVLRRLLGLPILNFTDSQALERLSRWAFATIDGNMRESWTREEIRKTLQELGASDPDKELDVWLSQGIITPASTPKHHLCFCNAASHYLLANDYLVAPKAIERLSMWAFATIKKYTESWTREEICKTLRDLGASDPDKELNIWLLQGIIIPASSPKHHLRFYTPSIHSLLSANHIKEIGKEGGTEIFPWLIDSSINSPWDDVLCYLVQIVDSPDDLLNWFAIPNIEQKERYRLLEIGQDFLRTCHYLDYKTREALKRRLVFLTQEENSTLYQSSIVPVRRRSRLEKQNGNLFTIYFEQQLNLHDFDQTQLKEILSNHFNVNELHQLYEQLQLEIDGYNVGTMIEEMRGRERLHYILDAGIGLRPDINWLEVLNYPNIQLTFLLKKEVEEFTTKQHNQFIENLSDILDINIAQIQIRLNFVAEAIHLTVNLSKNNTKTFLTYCTNEPNAKHKFHFVKSVRIGSGTDKLSNGEPTRQDRGVTRLPSMQASIKLQEPIFVPQQAPSQEPYEEEIDIAILTVLPEEHKAVRHRIQNIELVPGTEDIPNNFSWELGNIPTKVGNRGDSYRIVLTKIGRAGNYASLPVALETIAVWQPRYVFLVGIAGGLARDKLGLGDVVVSTHIYGYEYGKILAATAKYKPRYYFPYPCDHGLINKSETFAEVAPNWAHTIKILRPDGEIKPPKVLHKPVASGEKVIDETRIGYFLSVLSNAPNELYAVEMEGIGVAEAINYGSRPKYNPQFLMIRGISDIPSAETHLDKGTKERDKWKEYASNAAASFTVGYIASGWLPTRPYAAEAKGKKLIE